MNMSAALDPVATALLSGEAATPAPPAVVVAIAEDDRVHVSSAGVADLDTGELSTPGHTQDIASVSKVITTLAVLVLVSRAGLALDDPLGRIMGRRAGVHADATIDDLLRHRSGMREWWPLYLQPNGSDDPVATALALAPLSRRDTTRRYSDLGMQVLGEVVERVSGTTIAAALRELVLDPLGADTVTPAAPPAGAPVLAGPDGDAIEREMVRTGVPYPVSVEAGDFPWRTHRLDREPADGNAFHAFGGVAGHAGWFADAHGLLRVAAALAEPELIGIDATTGARVASTVDEGQGLGVRRYRVDWRGRERVLLGHPGFTGAFVGALTPVDGGDGLRIALLANRLYGAPAPGRDRLPDVESLWREAIAGAATIMTPTTSGERP